MLQSLKFLQKLVGPGKDDTPPDIGQLAPDKTLLVVGDIHGSFGLLQTAIKAAEEFIAEHHRTDAQAPHLVFVGDYVDRGETSAQVLEWIYTLQRTLPNNVTCLMGNHERMMLEFLDDPAGRGDRWLRNGGLQTLASYNIANMRENLDVERLTEASNELEAAMPEGMLDWLRSLPFIYTSGNICVVHAAMDPHLGPQQQSSQVMMWGHNEFMTTPREDGLWVVHGHTIVKEPQIRTSRIAIDTGAYHSGQLTIAVISPGACNFIQTGR